MRATGVMHPTDGPYVPPDTVTTLLLTGGSSTQAQDWLSSGSTALAQAGPSGAQLIKVTPVTTAGGAFFVMFNAFSTGAVAPASGTTIASSGVGQPIKDPTFLQIPGGSTGWSAFSYSSGLCIIEQWRK